MNLFKRWTSSVSSSFDWMITQVENHEALISSALREMQQAGSKAKAQLRRVQRDGLKMKQRVTELAELENVWQERALRIHASDEERAIECLRRKKLIVREKDALEKQLVEHTIFERQLVDDLQVIEERIAELKRRKNAMSARQYRAEALNAGAVEEIGLIAEIDEIFERWENKVDRGEAFTNVADNFEDEFASDEEKESLREELNELLANSADS